LEVLIPPDYRTAFQIPMTLSLRAKVFSVAFAGFATTLAVFAIAYLCFTRMTTSQGAQVTALQALRNQLEADMMHDALRADVLDAARAAAHKDAAACAKVLSNLEDHIRIFRDRVKENQSLPVTPAVREALQAVEAPLGEYIRAADEIVKQTFQDATAAEGQLPLFLTKFKTLEGEMEKVSNVIEESAHAFSDRNAAFVRLFSRRVIAALATGAVVLLCLSLLVARSIPRPFQGVTTDISALAGRIGSASAQVAAASQMLATGASEQAASLEETSASLEEMSSMTQRNSEHAARAKELANQTSTAADSGATSMQEMTCAMDQIKAAGDEVAKIIRTIDELAFQTNILALNAAVEAARAGDAGMGFAVVADEVRNLAHRSASAASETAEKIENSLRKSAQGVVISTKVATSLQEILARARQVDELLNEITTASREQHQGIRQINLAVAQVDKVTQRNAAGAEESASSAEELRAQADALKEVVVVLQSLVGGQVKGTPPPANVHSRSKSAAPASEPSPKPEHAPTKPAPDGAVARNGKSPLLAMPSAHDGGFMDF
jgi:hypothetical protein